MTTLGALTLPLACVEVGTRKASIKDQEYPGVDEIDGLDMGKRLRPIRVTGRLPDMINGPTKFSDIEGLDESTVADLTDTSRGGFVYPDCRVIDARTFEVRGAVVGGVSTQTCKYEIQLMSYREP